MKPILTIALMIFNISIFGQSLFFNEFKVINFNVPRSSDSYESRIIRISNDTLITKDTYPIGLYWNPINDNEIIGCNAWTIGKWNIQSDLYDTLYHNDKLVIVELTCNDNSCFAITTPGEQDRFYDYNILKINIENKRIEKFDFNDDYNIINLYASNRFLSFIDYDYNEETDLILTKLIIYDLIKNQFREIDRANSDNNEWFGGIEERSVMCWKNDNELYYFKKESDKSNGSIFKYDIKSKLRTREFELPLENIYSFTLKDNGIIILNDEKLIFMDKEGNEKLIYQ
ncbi:hypothetical protein ACE01N_20540, partial [Saccharicrinis sp. FJH2]|uniref:hypothetical protein n=1 Tax=Saccharicrinis sp. FJH65 TaxID=3344659 RepID=UPI0035F2ED58